MAAWPWSDEKVRAMYPGGRADPVARRMAHVWAFVLRHGVLPKRWVTLEVKGRTSGRARQFPLGMADVGGEWYLVSMLGECNWVRNVRASGGRATLWHGRPTECRLEEVPVAERAAILQRYVAKVPGGRPHIPVDRAAPLTAFAAVADRYPVFRVAPLELAAPASPGRAGVDAPATAPESTAPLGLSGPGAPPSGRWRRRARRLLIVVLLAVVGLFVAAGLSVKLQSTPPALGLPAVPAAAPSGPLAGSWSVTAGSRAGFRIAETVAFMTGTIVGRTNAVTGSLVIVGDDVRDATFEVDLRTILVGGKSSSQLASSLDTAADPTAVWRLVGSVRVGRGFLAGETTSFTVTGSLSLHGRTHPVSVTLAGRRSGRELEIAGSLPIAFASWDIAGAPGFGPLGSLADHGVAEFALVLRRP